MRMHPVDRKGDDAVVLCRILRAVDFDIRKLPHLLHQLCDEQILLLPDKIKADLLQIRNRARHPAGVRGVHRTGLKLVRHLRPGRLRARDIFDHLAAGEEGWHFVEQRVLSVEHTDAHRPHQLVPGECIEIRIQLLHVHRHMRCGLCAVHENHGTLAVRVGDDLLHGMRDAQHIGDMADCDKRGLFRDFCLIFRPGDKAVLIGFQPDKFGAFPLCQHLPGEDIGMMLRDA